MSRRAQLCESMAILCLLGLHQSEQLFGHYVLGFNAEGSSVDSRRPKYEQLLRELKIRPLKVQAARGVVVKLTEGSEVVVMGAEEMEAATV